jgi:2-polyprenyl-3-methyl-5-hydroxy-6-metoxy-1,4-benzoquinol methylase
MLQSVKSTLSNPTIHMTWEDVYRNTRSERLYEALFDWIAREGGVPQPARWLDIGCGIGQHSIRLKQRGYDVVAADYSLDRVQAVTAHLRDVGLADIPVGCEDLVDGLSYPSQSFDAILCWGVLMHIPEIEPAMLELVRVLKPSSRLFIYEANLHGMDAALSRLISLGKKALGKSPYSQISMTPYGREYWAKTAAGDLFIRHCRISALTSFFESHGCRLQARIGGEFTERYSMGGAIGALAHAWNLAWIRSTRSPVLAHGNLLVFQKNL